MNVNKKEKNTDDNEIKELRDISPNFFKIMSNKDDLVEISPEMDERMFKLIYGNGTVLKKNGKLNISEWLSWLKPMVFPMTQLAVALVLVVGLGGLTYYFLSKNNAGNSIPVEVSKNNYRDGNSKDDVIANATKVLLEKSGDENTNKLIKSLYSKLSMSTSKAIKLDEDNAYDIVISFNKTSESAMVMNITDDVGTVLYSKQYNLDKDLDLEKLADSINTDLLIKFKTSSTPKQ